MRPPPMKDERVQGRSTAKRYRPGRWSRVENVLMSALTRAGLVPSTYLLTTRGRRTGRPRSNPVTIIEHGQQHWLVAPYGPVSWVSNARDSGRVSLSRRRRTRHYAIREAARAEAGPVLKRYVTVATATRRYFELDEHAPVEEWVDVADRHPVFELLPLGALAPGLP